MAIASTLIDNTATLSALLDSLANLPNDPPSLYFDLEGEKLSRYGSISLLQLLVVPKNHVYLIDVHVLGKVAFTTPGTASTRTLKSILESPGTCKVCFDVRNDSNALYFHFGISLHNVKDVQLMEVASRRPEAAKNYLNGLAKCVEHDATSTFQEKRAWKIIKEEGPKLFAPEKGGSYEVFNKRPLNEQVQAYCVQDVQILPRLYSVYSGRVKPEWSGKVEDATNARVHSSQREDYQPQGAHKTLSPWQDYEPFDIDAHNERVLDQWLEEFNDPQEDAFDDYDLGEDNDFEDWTGNPSP